MLVKVLGGFLEVSVEGLPPSGPVDPGYSAPPGWGLYPSHPIAPGGPPPVIWPSPGHPAHPIAPGGPPPVIWPSPGHPVHPIAPGGPPPWVSHPIPPTVWPNPPGAGSGQTPVDPGFSAPPGWGLKPTNPIVIPPTIWPNPPEGVAPLPEHPIYIPPPVGSPPNTPPFEVHTIWTENTGWMIYLTPATGTEVPTPA